MKRTRAKRNEQEKQAGDAYQPQRIMDEYDNHLEEHVDEEGIKQTHRQVEDSYQEGTNDEQHKGNK